MIHGPETGATDRLQKTVSDFGLVASKSDGTGFAQLYASDWNDDVWILAQPGRQTVFATLGLWPQKKAIRERNFSYI